MPFFAAENHINVLNLISEDTVVIIQCYTSVMSFAPFLFVTDITSVHPSINPLFSRYVLLVVWPAVCP